MTAVESVRAVADAVLYEGFLLFPYHAGALKNKMPYQFGVVMPHGYADASEPYWMETQLLAEPGGKDARLEVTLRFLRIMASPQPQEIAASIPLAEGRCERRFSADGLEGILSFEIIRDGAYMRILLRAENANRVDGTATREQALQSAFVGAHAILALDGGTFISLLDPPEAARAAAERCSNRRVFPVLAGEAEEGGHSSTIALASPIILYDFPQIAPASRVQTFDATEIDELLMLSVAALTDEEKRAARATHRLAAEIVDRAEALNPHRVGERVRVHPKGRADIWDTFVEGMTGRICDVKTDMDGRSYVGVLFDDDPAAEMHEWYGRAFYYGTNEIEPLERAE